MQNAVLVLNANFEPLNVCNIRRAFGLLLVGKATLVLNGRGTIKTIAHNYDIPSVIRLEYMVKHPHPEVKLCKREIFRRDHYTCLYCGKHTLHLTVDHVLPKHMGGESTWENMVAACPACNHHKGGRTLEQSRMTLLHLPYRPPASAPYIYGQYLSENTEWMPFMDGW